MEASATRSVVFLHQATTDYVADVSTIAFTLPQSFPVSRPLPTQHFQSSYFLPL